MHKFWYHSPLRFYKTKEELYDMTNPQNCQFFGAKNPYPLEKGELHRFLIPNIDNEIINSNNFVGRNLLTGSDLKNQFTGTAFTVDGISYNTYCDGYAYYNGGLPNPSTIYHSYINNTTFGFPVVVYNESNGTRNWKGSYKVVNGQINSHGDFVISFDVYATGLGTKIFGGFLYAKKGDTVLDFHSGQFNIQVNKVNEWHRVTATCKLNDDVDLTKEVRFYCYGYGFSTNSILYVRKYKLEKGNKATDWSPAHEDEGYAPNLKLFLVGDTEQEIQSLMTVIDDKLYAVTFKCDDFVQGHFEIRNYSEPVFYSNCVKFIDSTDSDGRKFIRIATKHNYDKNLFPYSKSSNLYCVTNLPAYDLGRFTAEIDAKNNRVGNSASLISSESYTDEIVHYEFKAYGDANILSFIQVHAVNNEFYINGTQRTAIDKMEADEFAMIGKLKFTNVKNNLGLNKTINESDIFSDLQMQIIEKIPPDNFIEQASLFDGDIACKFNSDVYRTGDLTKKMRLFQNGIEILSKTFNQLTIFGNAVSFRFAIGGLTPGNYVVKIDDGMFKNSFGNVFQGITNNTDWNFTLVEEIIPVISISWEDGTNNDLSGTLNNITLKIKAETYSQINPIITYSWESSTDGISYTQFAINNSNKTVYLVPNNNFYRVKATLQDTSEIYSNVLKYTKEAVTTTDYYFKATRPYNYPGNDFVRYIDQYGNEQTETLIRSYKGEFIDENGIILPGDWVEAPCTLIVANSILEVVGAVTCTP